MYEMFSNRMRIEFTRISAIVNDFLCLKETSRHCPECEKAGKLKLSTKIYFLLVNESFKIFKFDTPIFRYSRENPSVENTRGGEIFKDIIPR